MYKTTAAAICETATAEEVGLVTIADNGVADKQRGRDVATVNKWGLGE